MKNTVLTSAFGSLRRTLLLSAVASLGLAATIITLRKIELPVNIIYG